MIDIKSLARARRSRRRYEAVISIEDPCARRKLRFHRTPHPDHLVLRLEDIDQHDPDLAGPDIHHVDRAIAFAREHLDKRILVHCHVGVCRSTATGLAIIADRLGPGNERLAVEALLASNPDAVPNLLMIGMADEVLQRNGALVDAWAEVESGNVAIAEYRRKKEKLLKDDRALFAARPEGGYHTAARCRPQTLGLTLV
ncbi:hypothetical protein [Rhizobium sp. BK176]|uniref:hypothetical protein n=1 Tax=Rhizobium sp. BK176 TaxID=2587071 RepID=UPI002167D8AB|nr:hypothetical protein [Rhizobium sp. BK176]MCS4089900.1 putative protein tyrosine phosphatase [Rhizobium sp. BK176]